MGFSSHRQTGLIFHDPARSFQGYTVYSVLGGDTSYLIDSQGQIVHTWKPPHGWQPYYGYLLPGGRLLVRCVTGNERWPGGGISGAVVELDWDSNVLWEYEESTLHHDHARLGNGNTMVIGAEMIPPEVARRVYAANPAPRGDATDSDEMRGDTLQEVAADGKIVWEWHAYEHLDPEIDRCGPTDSMGHEWTHCNAVEELPDGNLVLSFRTISSICKVDRQTGDVIWRWGKGVLKGQHNPTVLDSGNVLVFNNGDGRQGMSHSDIIEMDPKNGEVVWTFAESPQAGFFSASISGCQRLPNGNTLICEGRTGRLFEVTPPGEVVWEYVAPFRFPLREDKQQNAVFRCYRYAADSAELQGRL